MQWKCKICGYIHEADKPPDICPLCEAPNTEFVKVDDKSSS